MAVVVSRFNDFVTERLLSGAQHALRDVGVAEHDVTVVRVPGAYEIPMAAQRAAERTIAHDEALRRLRQSRAPERSGPTRRRKAAICC